MKNKFRPCLVSLYGEHVNRETFEILAVSLGKLLPCVCKNKEDANFQMRKTTLYGRNIILLSKDREAREYKEMWVSLLSF